MSMLRKVLLTLALMITTGAALFAQQGTLKGTVTDASTKKVMPFVPVILLQDGRQVGSDVTDGNGIYTVKPLAAGRYDIKVTYMGYKPIMMQGVPVSGSGISVGDIKMEATDVELEEVEIVRYQNPLIDKKTGTTTGIDAEEIALRPVHTVSGIVSQVAGVAHGGSSARGETGMQTIVNGVKVHTSADNIPKDAISDIQVILGGTPARIGESIGGTQVITLKPPSNKLMGQLGYETQINHSGYHRLNMFLTGPIYTKKDQNNVDRTIVGFRLSGFGATSLSGGNRPKDFRYRVLNEDKMNELTYYTGPGTGPLVYDQALGGIYTGASYLRDSDFESVKNIPGSRVWSGSLDGGLSVRFSENATLSINGSYQYSNSNDPGEFRMTNTYKQKSIAQGFSLSGDFTHRFPDVEGGSRSIKNLMYSITASYTRQFGSTFNPEYGDRLFEYGYVGKFTPVYAQNGDIVDRIKEYNSNFNENEFNSLSGIAFGNPVGDAVFNVDEYGDTVSVDNYTIYTQISSLPVFSSIGFTPFDKNPLSNYTSHAYALRNQLSPGSEFTEMSQIAAGNIGGIINGGSAPTVYGLLGNVGTISSSYSKYRQDFLYFQAKASADIKGHAIEFGLQYDQSTYRSYGINAAALWTSMRDNVNKQIYEYDIADSTNVFIAGNDTTVGSINGNLITVINKDKYILYKRNYNKVAHTQFDIKLREKEGREKEGLDWINIDAYDFEDLGKLSLDMFSADELLNNGNSPTGLSYMGYDYTGKLIKGKTDLDKFFTDPLQRTVGAWSPIYMAGYIQDEFYFNDLLFNIGVRVDYFDANQKVLKDPYLLYNAYTVGEKTNLSHPSNAKSDWVIYLNNSLTELADGVQIAGYRSGSTWYNADGVEIADPFDIKGTNSAPTPYRKGENPSSPANVSADAFKDYEPQIVAMPRIAFSFPVSDKSQFKASYDIIARRPSAGAWRANYFDYLNRLYNVGTIANPNLDPEKITNYEVGFEQVLSTSSAIRVYAYYKETRDLVSQIQYAGADPNPNIYSYGNINYKTTKGLSITYDLRRSKNLRMSANYTFQYAEGTGISSSIMQALRVEGYPNLKILNPIGDDRRHELKADIDFRYQGGVQYNGPTSTRVVKGVNGAEDTKKTIRWFENMGAHLTGVAFSGTPYTKTLSYSQSTIVGDYNGSRYPWQFYVTFQLDKTWNFASSSSTRRSQLTAYARIDNLLDIRNIVGVYSVTGDPEDDGYLTDPDLQPDINSRLPSSISYRELYLLNLRASSFGNYSAPRTITLGLSYSF